MRDDDDRKGEGETRFWLIACSSRKAPRGPPVNFYARLQNYLVKYQRDHSTGFMNEECWEDRDDWRRLSWMTPIKNGNIVYRHQSVLPKNRSFIANSGTRVTVLSKGRSSTATSGCSFTRDK